MVINTSVAKSAAFIKLSDMTSTFRFEASDARLQHMLDALARDEKRVKLAFDSCGPKLVSRGQPDENAPQRKGTPVATDTA